MDGAKQADRATVDPHYAGGLTKEPMSEMEEALTGNSIEIGLLEKNIAYLAEKLSPVLSYGSALKEQSSDDDKESRFTSQRARGIETQTDRIRRVNYLIQTLTESLHV